MADRLFFFLPWGLLAFSLNDIFPGVWPINHNCVPG